MTQRWRKTWTLALVLAAGLACKAKNNGTMVLIEVDSDIGAAQLDEIQVTVTPSRGKGTSQIFPLGATVRPPVRLAVIPEGEPAIDFVVSVKGLSTRQEVASLVGTTSFAPGMAFIAEMFLSRDCKLPKATTCPADQQCVAGGKCVSTDEAVTVRALGTEADAAPPPKPDAPIERPPRETSVLGGAWTVVSPPMFTGNLNGVHPVSDREIWVVGTGGALGFVYRFDGNAWAAVPLPAQTRPLQAVWAAAPDDVWAVGFGGTILHRVGGVFSAIPSGVTANLAAVFGTSTTDVWFVGANKTVLRWNGNAITPAAEGVTTDITAGSASGPNNIWIAGTGGGIYRRNNNAWHRQAEGMLATTVFGIWTSGANDVWAVGDGGGLHYDGNGWTASQVGAAVALGVWGAADNDVWVVGRGLLGRGITAHFDGNSWTEVVSPVTGPLQAVRGVSGTDVWAVGKEVVRYR
jgi:hypothetical protein